MRRIAIIGAGQAGLHFALALQAQGYDVTVCSDRTPEQIRCGNVMSTQAMFGPARALERSAQLALWDDRAPDVHIIHAAVAGPDAVPALAFDAPLDAPQHAVDQRVKMPAWLELFEDRGGRVQYRPVTPTDLGPLAESHDLTVVAAGRGVLSGLFARHDGHSRFDAPQRTLACVYLHGVTSPETIPGRPVRIHVLPGAGELFLQPALTTSGVCTILLWEAVPHGPLDRFADRPDPATMLARSLDLLRQYVPWEYDACAGATPTDAHATLYGAVTPTVRRPVARVGTAATPVLGMADTLVINDPVTGQGANNAARCAAAYTQSVIAHGDRAFDAAWMRRTFDRFWEHARHSIDFTTTMLAPTPDHIAQALAQAAARPVVARRFANTYADPADFSVWLGTPEATHSYLAGQAGQ